MLPMIGDNVLIWLVLAGLSGGIGGLLPMIGDNVLIWRVLAGISGGIGGLLPMIGDNRDCKGLIWPRAAESTEEQRGAERNLDLRV